jgi:hypothetical protein
MIKNTGKVLAMKYRFNGWILFLKGTMKRSLSKKQVRLPQKIKSVSSSSENNSSIDAKNLPLEYFSF